MRGGGYGHLESTDAIDLVVIDFGENYLLMDAHGEVPSPVEAPPGKSPEVPDTGKGHINEAVQKVVHARSPEGDAGTDGIAFSNLESGDGLPGSGDAVS